MRSTSAPARTASVAAATVPHSRSAAGSRSSQDPAEHRADEVLARRARRRAAGRARAARRAAAGSPGPARAMRSKSSPGSIAICSSADTKLARPPRPSPRTTTSGARPRRRSARRPVDPRRALDVHQHVAAAALGDQLEHLLRAAGDVVDRDRARRRAPAAPPRPRRCRPRPARRPPASPSIAGTSAAASSSAETGGPLRAATAPTSSMSKPASDQRQPVGDRPLRGPAARPLEHRVGGDVDDPRAQRLREAPRQSPVSQPPVDIVPLR